MTPRRTTDLTHTLVEGLRNMIAEGSIHPGARLPPERELARQFGVNRASIRQALKALDVIGIVYQRVGDGTYLTQDASSALACPLEFLILVDRITQQELLDARMIVEPELAARAATRATDEQIAEMDRVATEMEMAAAAGESDLSAKDLHFHELIWRASGNRLCDRMFASIHRAMAQAHTLEPMEKSEADLHRKIADAIRNHDEDGARRQMRDHLRHSVHSGTDAPVRTNGELKAALTMEPGSALDVH